MTDANTDGVYEYTATGIVPAEYQFKYYNGDGGDPEGENFDFLTGGCGVSNGVGGYNRLLDLTGRLSDTTLTIWYYNTCNEALASVGGRAGTQCSGYPDPGSATAVIELQRWERTAYGRRGGSITGQVMQERKGLRTDRVEISREGLNAGLYFVELRDAKGRSTTQKIVVQ